MGEASERKWSILTGEYPPEPGGVADYTRRLAQALARAGDTVEVWAPSRKRELERDDRVIVRALPDRFGPRSLARLNRELASQREARLFVQWVPQAFGMHGMNVPLCAWLAARRGSTWIMFHEVSYPFVSGAPLKHNAIWGVTRAMASILATRADRTFVSTLAWKPLLHAVAPFARDATWLPVPSNIPENVGADDVARTRAKLGLAPLDVVLGSFGTYAPHIAQRLSESLALLLARDQTRVVLLMGRGSLDFLNRTLRPHLARLGAQYDRRARVIATGELEVEDVAAHIAACSALIQPYVDGVTTRRTTAMAGLALGVPLVTNDGALTESVWREEPGVALAASPEAIAPKVEWLLADAGRMRSLGASGRALYERRFSLACTVRTLREEGQ